MPRARAYRRRVCHYVPVTDRAERIVRNEILFREVNEQVESLSTASSPGQSFPAVCECGSGECSDVIRIDWADYEAVRAHAERFLVTPGHEIEEVEDLIEQHDTFSVVAKKPGAPRELAAATDLRSP